LKDRHRRHEIRVAKVLHDLVQSDVVAAQHCHQFLQPDALCLGLLLGSDGSEEGDPGFVDRVLYLFREIDVLHFQALHANAKIQRLALNLAQDLFDCRLEGVDDEVWVGRGAGPVLQELHRLRRNNLGHGEGIDPGPNGGFGDHQKPLVADPVHGDRIEFAGGGACAKRGPAAYVRRRRRRRGHSQRIAVHRVRPAVGIDVEDILLRVLNLPPYPDVDLQRLAIAREHVFVFPVEQRALHRDRADGLLAAIGVDGPEAARGASHACELLVPEKRKGLPWVPQDQLTPAEPDGNAARSGPERVHPPPPILEVPKKSGDDRDGHQRQTDILHSCTPVDGLGRLRLVGHGQMVGPGPRPRNENSMNADIRTIAGGR
jgi:hypothetical protein